MARQKHFTEAEADAYVAGGMAQIATWNGSPESYAAHTFHGEGPCLWKDGQGADCPCQVSK